MLDLGDKDMKTKDVENDTWHCRSCQAIFALSYPQKRKSLEGRRAKSS